MRHTERKVGKSGAPEGAEAENVSAIIGLETAGNGYFSAVSFVYRAAEFVFLFAFIIFLAVYGFANVGEITYEKAEYVLRNFTLKLDENSENRTEIIYDPDSRQSFALFGKGLSVAGNSGIAVFSATGRKTCSSQYSMTSASLSASEKYSAVYDSGGTEYLIFNSFSRVYRGTSEYPVRSFCMSDSGRYLMITGDSEYNSAVRLFSSDFELMTVFRKNGYVTSAALDPEGKRIFIATVDGDSSGSGGFRTELTLYEAGGDSPVLTFDAGNVFPMRAFFLAPGDAGGDGGFGLLCRDRLLIWSPSGIQVCDSRFGGGNVELFACSGDTAAVVLRHTDSGVSVTYSITVAGDGGYSKYSSPIDTDGGGRPSSLTVGGGRAFCLMPGNGTVFAMSSSDGSSRTYSCGRSDVEEILAYGRDDLYLLCRSSAFTFTAAP